MVATLNRQEQIYGAANEPLRTDDGKLSGEEVTNLVNCCSGPPQTAAQYRKRFNDIRRRARKKLAVNPWSSLMTGDPH